MSDLFEALLHWVTLNPIWAGVAVFLVALAESLAIVGILVPGVIILFGIGALIGNGTLEFWSTCLWAIAGAVMGDNLSFWLGHHYEDRFEHSRWFRLHPTHLKKGLDFFHRHGGMSIAFGRFFGPIRAIVPLVAGLMRMDPLHFMLANLLSAMIWAPAYLLPGMVFGASMDQAGEVAFRLVIILLLLAGLFFGLARIARLWLHREALAFIFSLLLIMPPLLWLGFSLYHPPSAFLIVTKGATPPPAEQGWQPLPPRRMADFLKFLSPTAAIETLPSRYKIEHKAVWVRPTGPEQRELLIIDQDSARLVSEIIHDFWLFRFPVTQSASSDQHRSKN